MFNKVLFSKLLKKAIGNCTIQEYADKSNSDRSYISRYVHKRMNCPPKPSKLEDLAKASDERVSFKELMIAAGHIKSKKELIIHNLKLLQGDMSFEELSKDVLNYHKNKLYEEIYTPKFFSDVIKGKVEIEISHLIVICLYAQIDTVFFDRENTCNDLILAKKNYAQVKQERNRITSICKIYSVKIELLEKKGVDMSKYIGLFEEDSLEFLNKALELQNIKHRLEQTPD